MSWEDDKAPPERTVGAYSVGTKEPRRRPGWLIPLLILLGLALLGLLLWALLHGRGTDDKKKTAAAPAAGASASPSTSPSVAPSTSPSPAPSAGPSTDASATPPSPATAVTASAAGRLLAGGQPVLPLPGTGPVGALGRFTGQTATAETVPVQSVPADEGFWVGNSTTDRVWVQLAGTGESGYTVKPGDRVSFTTGKVVPTGPAFAGQVGVNAAEGAAQLTAQGQHITVAKGDLRLSP